MKQHMLSLHPVFNFQSWYPIKMFKVVSNNGQLLTDCLACNDHIKFINQLPFYLMLRPTDERLSRKIRFFSSADSSPS